MKTKYLIICATLCASLASCVTTVPVSTNDTIPPKISIATAADGKLVASQGEPVQESVLQGSEIGFIASGSDTSGIKSLSFKVLSGGRMHINDAFKVDTLLENVIVNNTSKNLLVVGGSLVFDTPSSEMRLQAVTEDWAGNQASIQTYVLVQVPGPEARISANKETINRGESVTLTYETENADAAFLNGVQLSTFNGTRVVTPNFTTDYILKSTSYVGEAADTIRVVVNQPIAAPQILSFSSNKSTVNVGETFNIQWNCTNTTAISITANGSNVLNSNNAQGNQNFNWNTPGNYNLVIVANGPGGSASRQFSIMVTVPEPVQTCIRTNCLDGGLYCFKYEASANGNSSWALNWSWMSSTKKITSIKNNMNRDVLLILGLGDNQVISFIGPGQTFTAPFSGKNLAQFYRAVTENDWDGDLPPGIDLTICFE